jgi:chaperonin GroEL (HSP60 family)
MIPGGGAPEIELSQKLEEYARGLKGVDSMITRAFADALEIIPYTLAENAGLNPIQVNNNTIVLCFFKVQFVLNYHLSLSNFKYKN